MEEKMEGDNYFLKECW